MTSVQASTIAARLPSRRWASRIGFALLTAAAVALFVTAGNWQRERLHAKQALRERYDAAAAALPSALPSPRSDADWAALRYQPVILTGAFDAARQILVDNRVHAGQPGYEAVAPFVMDDGRRVLVDRGWVAQGRTRARLPDVPVPQGTVSVRGRINLPPSRYVELADAPAKGPLWQHVDPARFAQATGIEVLPIVVEQTAPASPGDTLVRERPAPDFGVDQHRVYMVQWYSFAALAVALWAYLSWRAERKGDER